MIDQELNDLEVAPKSAVMEAARAFAEVFSETSQYREFEKTYHIYRQDTQAQSALQNFQEKQASLKAMLMLNAVSDTERQELQRLQDAFYQQPSVIQYLKTQQALIAISQEVGDLLTNAVGLDYANSCRSGGCCG